MTTPRNGQVYRYHYRYLPINNNATSTNEADVVMQLIKKLMLPLFGKATMEKIKDTYDQIIHKQNYQAWVTQ